MARERPKIERDAMRVLVPVFIALILWSAYCMLEGFPK
jgi:hypothetical protein